MNLLNYFKGNISKIDAESPTKRMKNLSPAQQIYLQQIVNYIQAEGGYDILKQKLFKAINELYMHDSSFIQQIVIALRKGLQSKRRQQQLRTLSITQDLISNCNKIMNQAFNNKNFTQALYNSATFLINVKAFDRQQIRQRIAGLSSYWHSKFQSQPHYSYHQLYSNLKKTDIQFPQSNEIKQRQNQNKMQNNIEQQQIKNASVVIKDCQDIAKETQSLLKQKSSKIDTNYVRMLKAKTKKLHALSTSSQVQLTVEQKQQISITYKKIRTQLKQIDKINEQINKQKEIKKQKSYLQQKMTPKKNQKLEKAILQPSHKELLPNMIKKQSKQQIILTPTKKEKVQQPFNLLDIELVPSSNNELNKKKQSQPQSFQFNKDILDIDFNNIRNPRSNQQEQKFQIQIAEEQTFKGTPKKGIKKQTLDLLQLDNNKPQNYYSPSVDSQKKLNFKQLYAVNQLSPELKDLDLGTPQKLKSKESIKSDDDAQFGDFS